MIYLKTVSTFLLIMVVNFCAAQTGSYSGSLFHKKANKDTLVEKVFLGPPPVETYVDQLLERWIWKTESSNGIFIQNSFPKGGGHRDASGNPFGYRIFWTRVVNQTDSALDLKANFPESFPFPMLQSPEAYFILFLPQDTMSIDKVGLYDFGATGLESFVNRNEKKRTSLQKTIPPGQDYFFYVAAIFNDAYGVTRGGFVLKGNELFYAISGIDPQLDRILIPGGHINFKK